MESPTTWTLLISSLSVADLNSAERTWRFLRSQSLVRAASEGPAVVARAIEEEQSRGRITGASLAARIAAHPLVRALALSAADAPDPLGTRAAERWKAFPRADCAAPDLSWLLGHDCRAITIDDSGAHFDFEQAGLRVDCAWRVIADGHVAIGSEDHGQMFGQGTPTDAAARAIDVLATRAIQRAVIEPESSDLMLDFGDAVRLEVWVSSSGYENWEVYGSANQRVLALGGGELAVWT